MLLGVSSGNVLFVGTPIASKLAPTGFGVDHKCCEQHKSLVGASLLAMRPVQALQSGQNNTFATSANRLAKCTVRPSLR
jgi:hypothetical protein